MAHAVIELNAVAAQNVDALNRPAKADVALDAGNVFQLATKSTTAGEGDVWIATAPATDNLNNLWMAGEVINIDVVNNGKTFRNITADPTDATHPAGEVFEAFKPQVGDIITLTAPAMTGGTAPTAYASAANGVYTLTPGASATASALALHLIQTTYISIGNGALGSTQRAVAYKFEVVAN